ncbi:MAG: right-handed parallel beta-helix repeat-containing protein [Candidatus Zixiibacteriota bacterium]
MIQLIAGHDYATAATRYVSYSGNNTPPYTSLESATDRISLAAQYARPGDTIRVAAGIYYDPESILLNNGITLIGAGQELTELRSQSGVSGQIVCGSGDLTVADMRFRGVYKVPLPDAIFFQLGSGSLHLQRCLFDRYECAVSFFGSYLEIEDCLFQECGENTDAINVGSGNGLIENNTFINRRQTYFYEASINIEIGGYHASNFDVVRNIFHGYQNDVDASGSNGMITVENNLFLNNFIPPPNYIPPYVASAPYVYLGTPYSTVRNNLFEACFEGESGRDGEKPPCLYVEGYQYSEVRNNIFVGRQPGMVLDIDDHRIPGMSYSFEISYNDFWLDAPHPQVAVVGVGNFGCEEYSHESELGQGSIINNICRNPMFADTLGYFLQLYSPCIDAGYPEYSDSDGTRSDTGPWGGPGGRFYSYQDLPPQTPQRLYLNQVQQLTRLSWLGNSESDFSHYILFRDTQSPPALDSEHVLTYISSSGGPFGGPEQSGKQPLRGGLLPTINSYELGGIQSLRYLDMAEGTSESFTYALVAVDYSGLVSGPATVGQAGSSERQEQARGPLPEEFALDQNFPNPFNASTAIIYNLPNIGAQPAAVTLMIYNSLGQVVRILVDQRQYPGRQIAYWDGYDQRGKEVASGIYFYKLQVSGVDFVKSKKMLLIK